MEKSNTKQKILDEALNLFSVKGYDGVSVRDIADAVGIKDSSLYKHFKSKREIFDMLLAEMNRRFDETVVLYRLPQGEISAMARQYGENDLNWLKTAVDGIFLFFVADAYAKKFRHVLMIEQYKDTAAGKIFEEFFINIPISFQTALFDEMMQAGYFRKADPRVAATQFYGPMLLLIIMYDSKPGQQEEALQLLHSHVEEFARNYTITHGEQV